MVTMAARISSRVLDSEARNASAAPWNWLTMASGRPISCCTCSMAATAAPSETPGARLNDRVTAGNWPMWLTSSAAGRSSMRTSEDSGTWPLAPAALLLATYSWRSACGPRRSAASVSSTTRYWLAWV
ncbi:hypothetical protein D3C81_1710900 [compost metagenome]